MAEVYLTFDDGPDRATAEVLDVLLKHKVTATFFLNLDRGLNPTRRTAQFAIIRRMLTEGHSIANHGVDHDPASVAGYQRAKTADVKADFADNEAILKDMFTKGKSAYPGLGVARLPGDGRGQRAFVDMIVNELRVPHAGWDMEFCPNGIYAHVGSYDWQSIKGVAATRSGLPRSQDVLLLHDQHWSGQAALLGKVVAKLRESFTVRGLLPLPSNLGCVRYVR